MKCLKWNVITQFLYGSQGEVPQELNTSVVMKELNVFKWYWEMQILSQPHSYPEYKK